MTCRQFEQFLAAGLPLTSDAQSHLESCAGCRALMEVLDDSRDRVNEAGIRTGTSILLSGLKPVQPLPPDWVLILLTIGVFLGFTLLTAASVGMQGYFHLTPAQRIVYYGAILVLSLLFSIATVQAAIPGARIRIPANLPKMGTVPAMSAVVIALFHNFGREQFVVLGIPCLRFGCICAAMFGALATFFLRRGYVTQIAATAWLIGAFAGFSGVAVLSLHCPLQDAAHIIVWHFGAVVLSAIGGATIGFLIFYKDAPIVDRHSSD